VPLDARLERSRRVEAAVARLQARLLGGGEAAALAETPDLPALRKFCEILRAPLADARAAGRDAGAAGAAWEAACARVAAADALEGCTDVPTMRTALARVGAVTGAPGVDAARHLMAQVPPEPPRRDAHSRTEAGPSRAVPGAPLPRPGRWALSASLSPGSSRSSTTQGTSPPRDATSPRGAQWWRLAPRCAALRRWIARASRWLPMRARPCSPRPSSSFPAM
jgi:hypothetical protein